MCYMHGGKCLLLKKTFSVEEDYHDNNYLIIDYMDDLSNNA